MSRNTKSHNNKDVRRRSALSFIGGDGSLDIDDILQSEPWKNVEKFKNSEAGCIQNMLDDFVKIITQENTVESNEGLLKIIKGKKTRFYIKTHYYLKKFVRFHFESSFIYFKSIFS